jgi:hypothetical protein
MTPTAARAESPQARLRALRQDLKGLRARLEELADELAEQRGNQLAVNRLRCVLQDRLEPAVRDLESIRLQNPPGAPS